MNRLRTLSLHPGRAAALAALAVALILTAIPITYQRTIGYEARLTLTPVPDAGSLRAVALQWKALLRAESVQARVDLRDASQSATLVAEVPRGQAATVESSATGFARALAARGLHATAEVEPRVRSAVGSVYAMAADRIQEIRIRRGGKTDAEVAAEIRERLAALGAVSPDVSVTREGSQTRITIQSGGAPGGSTTQRITVSGDSK